MLSLTSWLDSRPTLKTTRRVRLLVESLENRSVPAIVTVTNREDDVNGTVTSIAALVANNGGDGISLREAITAANVTPGTDEIRFDIGDAVQVIAPENDPLPPITDGLVINGADRPAGRPNQSIVLSGEVLPAAGSVGFTFTQGSNGSRVWGLTIREFTNDGILIYNASDIHVGGSGAGQGNVLYSNTVAVSIGGSVDDNVWGASNIQVVGNVIGTSSTVFDAQPLDKANGTGIRVTFSGGVVIGGGLESERNILVYNGTGIEIVGCEDVDVYNNYIGTANGTIASGNGTGISVKHLEYEDALLGFIRTTGVRIGGDADVAAGGGIEAAANIISGNTGNGIEIDGDFDAEPRAMPGLVLSGNFIGVASDGFTPLRNVYGIEIKNTSSVVIGSRVNNNAQRNIISGNDSDGIYMDNATKNYIRYNYIGVGADGETLAGNGGWGINDVSAAKVEGESSQNDIRDNFLIDNAFGGINVSNSSDVIDGNVITANGGVAGILIAGASSLGNLVSNNTITANDGDGIRAEITVQQGVALGLTIAHNTVSDNGGSGVALVSDSMLGAPTPDAGASVHGNTISGNDGDGITVTAGGSHRLADNTVRDNGGNGILLAGTTRYNQITASTVTGNTLAGLGTTDTPGIGNKSSGTTYYNNGGLGIDRGSNGVTTDGVPVLAAAPAGGAWLIYGELQREPFQEYVIQFFDNTAVDPSDYGEGESLHGAVTVTTDATGYAEFTYPVAAPPGGGLPRVRATSTGTDPGSWTSEFSTLTLRPPAVVTGRVFNDGWEYTAGSYGDYDRDGRQTGAEGGYGNVTVQLLNPDGTVAYSTQTNDYGYYTFSNVAAGSYRVRFGLPTPSDTTMTYRFTAADQGADDAIDSDAHATTGETALFAVAPGGTYDIDAGVIMRYIYSG